jgi:hypothetical protein
LEHRTAHTDQTRCRTDRKSAPTTRPAQRAPDRPANRPRTRNMPRGKPIALGRASPSSGTEDGTWHLCLPNPCCGDQPMDDIDPAEADSSCAAYLHVPQLLALQHPQTQPAGGAQRRDEHLFIMVHQASGPLLAHALVELRQVRHPTEDSSMSRADFLAARSAECFAGWAWPRLAVAASATDPPTLVSWAPSGVRTRDRCECRPACTE